MATDDAHDPVLEALEDLIRVLRECTDRNQTSIKRAMAIRRLRARGLPYSDIVPMEERPLVVELLTETLSELSNASGRFRAIEARQLYEEGLTMAEIAELFGVTRQRVAALLGSKPKRARLRESSTTRWSAVTAVGYLSDHGGEEALGSLVNHSFSALAFLDAFSSVL